jgi:hypothetical protein
LDPEQRLMLAVLEDAVSCFQKYPLAKDTRRKKLFHEAEDWILEQNSDWLFSFESICEVSGLNPQYIRQGLMRWREKEQAARRNAKIHCSTEKKRKPKGISSRETIRSLRKTLATGLNGPSSNADVGGRPRHNAT